MSEFKALRVHQGPNGRFARVDSILLDDLTPGDVVIRVAYSSLNYKDALAITGTGAILRALPRTAGIDLSGVGIGEHRSRRVAAFGDHNVVAVARDHALQKAALHRIVVDDENALDHGRHPVRVSNWGTLPQQA